MKQSMTFLFHYFTYFMNWFERPRGPKTGGYTNARICLVHNRKQPPIPTVGTYIRVASHRSPAWRNGSTVNDYYTQLVFTMHTQAQSQTPVIISCASHRPILLFMSHQLLFFSVQCRKLHRLVSPARVRHADSCSCRNLFAYSVEVRQSSRTDCISAHDSHLSPDLWHPMCDVVCARIKLLLSEGSF